MAFHNEEKARMSAASITQRRTWFMHRHGDDASHGNLVAALRMTGGPDTGALAAALTDLAARHPALRTRFPAGPGGEPAAVTGAAGPVPLPETPADDADTALDEEARRPFDLTAEAPFRARLLRLGPGRYLLVLITHHIAVGPRFLPRLLTELGHAYGARRDGRAPRWTTRAPDPLDRARAERNFAERSALPGTVAARRAAHWRAAFADLPAPVTLPAARQRTPRTSTAAATLTVPLPGALLDGLTRGTGTPADCVLHAAVAVLLHQTGGGTDIVLAARKPAADTTGAPDDLLPLRLDLTGGPGFGTLARQAAERLRTAHRHDVPFAWLLPRPARPDAPPRLLQVLSETTREDATAAPRLPGLTTRAELPAAHTTEHDLHVTLRRTGQEHGPAELRITYARDLFDPSAVGALAEALGTILRTAAADPAVRAGRVDMLPAARRRGLTGAGRTARPPAGTVPDLVRRQVLRTPDAVAVTDGGTTLTYRELDTAAARLAVRLRQAGARPEAVVGLAVARSADLVVALLAVLLSGAAYLPLDPRYPSGRLASMLEDARPCLVLTDRETAPLLPDHGVPQLRADDPGAPAGPAAAQRDLPRPRPGNLAYVMYTSGSTGRPKGVAVTHGAVVNGVTQLVPLVGMRPGAVMLAGTSLNFDVSVFEIVTALATGARLDVVRDVLVVAERGGWSGDVLHTVPSALAEILDRVRDGLRVRTVICAGERLPAQLVARVRAELPGATMINAYGQTESFYATAHVLTGRAAGAATVPIGTPLATMRAYVLGPGLLPLPPGVTGELYVGGVVGRGYHGRPAPTADRFVADPFAAPGRRMYRTGDLARWNAGGHLELLGRADAQMKVRGVRVEPAEIEAVLTTHPDVAQAAVTVRYDERGQGAIVAYLVPAAASAAGAEHRVAAPRVLRRHVADRLPAVMIPAAFVVLDRLPLTPNGKLDRSRLPEPGQSGTKAGRAGA